MRIISSYDRVVMEEGRLEGFQEGRQETLLRVFELQLEARFGPIQERLKERIRELNADRLEQLVIAPAKFSTIDEVTDWLDKQGV